MASKSEYDKGYSEGYDEGWRRGAEDMKDSLAHYLDRIRGYDNLGEDILKIIDYVDPEMIYGK